MLKLKVCEQCECVNHGNIKKCRWCGGDDLYAVFIPQVVVDELLWSFRAQVGEPDEDVFAITDRGTEYLQEFHNTESEQDYDYWIELQDDGDIEIYE